ATRIRSARTIERAAGYAISARRAVRKTGDERIVRRHADLCIVFQQALFIDVSHRDIAAVLAEQQVLAIGWIGAGAVAAAWVDSEGDVVLQDNAGVGVEPLDSLRRTQGQDGSAVSAGIRV